MNVPNRLEFLHQLRNARVQHLIHLKKENEREDRSLEIVISWAQDALLEAEIELGIETLKWTKEIMEDPDFEGESEIDKRDIIEENNFYTSWLM
tara:strand:+ start:1250 stop:1531 length:282 start_codon:yes stop_codon:yes gene_type:complete